MTDAPKTPVTLFLDKIKEETGSRPRIPNSKIKYLGKELKKGEEAARAFVAENDGKKDTACPPAKCDVVDQSRPFSEWPIHRVSEVVQQHIYNLPYEQFLDLRKRKLTSKEAHETFFREAGISGAGLHVQGVNLVLTHALRRYEGVVKRIENQNEEKRKKSDRKNEALTGKGLPPEPFEGKPTFDEDQRLLEKPGINPNLYCWQQVSPVLLTSTEGLTLPAEYKSYGLEPTNPLPPLGNRLEIPKGTPGYVPEWQRDPATNPYPLSANKHRRMRHWSSNQNLKAKPGRKDLSPERLQLAREAKAKGAILAKVSIGEDWIVFDLRGAKRNAQWRRVAGREMPSQEILDMFTGDPVVDTRRRIVSLSYKQGVTGIEVGRLLKAKQGREKLLELTQPSEEGLKQEIGVVTVDLGQTHPVAAGIWRVGQDAAGQFTQERMGGSTYWWNLDQAVVHSPEGKPQNLREMILAYRTRYDDMERRFREEAVASLSPEHQALYREYEGTPSEKTRQLLCTDLGLDPNQLPWDQMGGHTFFISQAFLDRGGAKERVEFTHVPKSMKCKDKTCKHAMFQHAEEGCTWCECKATPKPTSKKSKAKESVVEVRSDLNWAKLFRPKLAKEVRDAHSKITLDLRRTSPDFDKLAKSKKELARRCVNTLLKRARHLTQCRKIVIVIEDLNAPFFHGSGKKTPGWDGFFEPKKENRWFIQVLHKGFSDLPADKGMVVIEVWPARTSITCIDCGHVDKLSREGERFSCTACGKIRHADGEVATTNLLKVALTGEAMPKPPCEQAGGAKTPGGARKERFQVESTEEQVVPASEEGDVAAE